MPDSAAEFCRPFVRETRQHKLLFFSTSEVQSQMSKRDPDALVIDYTRTMMAFLLFVARPERIAIVGLGGGSLAKFCHRELPWARIDVVEVNPHVVRLRDEFKVPPDGERFQVHVADGARFITGSPRQFDVVLLDAYTRDGLPAKLGSQAFYEACRYSLTEGGVMVSNLYCADRNVQVERIRASFGPIVVVDEPVDANQVVFAPRGAIPRSKPALPLVAPAPLRREAWQSLRASFARVALACDLQRQGQPGVSLVHAADRSRRDQGRSALRERRPDADPAQEAERNVAADHGQLTVASCDALRRG